MTCIVIPMHINTAIAQFCALEDVAVQKQGQHDLLGSKYCSKLQMAM